MWTLLLLGIFFSPKQHIVIGYSKALLKQCTILEKNQKNCPKWSKQITPIAFLPTFQGQYTAKSHVSTFVKPQPLNAKKYNTFKLFLHSVCVATPKLDGVGHLDNRPSTDYLHHYVRKKEINKKIYKKYP